MSDGAHIRENTKLDESIGSLSAQRQRLALRLTTVLGFPYHASATMWTALADLVGEHLKGCHGAAGRAQGAVVALAFGLVCHKALRVGCAVKRFFWRQCIRPAKDLKKYGSWAAVTGATDGIGRAYCDHLAKQGVHSVRRQTFMFDCQSVDDFCFSR